MPSAKVALRCALAALVALTLTACGQVSKPLAGTPGVMQAPGTRGKVDDPRTAKVNHVTCLRNHHFNVVTEGATNVLIEPQPAGPRVHFEPTPGMAQGAQIANQAAGAEVIGSALLYPDQAPDQELKQIEDCLAEGVTG
jgi:hypothetical protein